MCKLDFSPTPFWGALEVALIFIRGAASYRCFGSLCEGGELIRVNLHHINWKEKPICLFGGVRRGSDIHFIMQIICYSEYR